MHAGNAAVARRLGMNTTDAAAIEHIAMSPTAIGPAELGERLGVTKSSATEIVDRLVAAGHLERVREESDRRRFRLVPTPFARDAVSREIDPLMQAIQATAADLSDREAATVVQFLRSLERDHRRFALRGDAQVR